jgi:hypothetical protein
MVRHYRLYFIGSGGHIRGVIELACADDDAAIAAAERQDRAQPMELWERARRVKTWAAAL